MLTIVITGLVLMRAWKLSEVLFSSSDVWKEWELRGVVFLSLALQIVLICLGNRRKYLPQAWIGVVTWSAYLLADSVAIYAVGMISSKIWEIKAGKLFSKMDSHAELSTFWAPFLLLHLGGPDTISAYAMEDNELWLRHSLTLVYQTGLTLYVLVMGWTHPTLSFLAILILLSGFYKYGERVWVLRAASDEYFKDSLNESQRRRKDSDKIAEELKLKWRIGYDVVPHRVIDIDNDDAIMIDFAIAEFSSKKLSSRKDLEDLEYKRVVGTMLSASRLLDTSQRLFADHLFSMEERDSSLSILSGKHCAGDFKVVEIELGLIYDQFYSKAKAVYTRWGFICRLAILFSICVALVLFSFTDKRSYSKPDIFLTFLLLGAAIFVELYALAHVLLSDQLACWLIKNKQSPFFNIINRIRPLLGRCRWSNSMGQYNLMSFKENDSCWWKFLKLLHIEEMAAKFLYQTHAKVTDDIKQLILSKIKEMEAKGVKELPVQMKDRRLHVLSTHKMEHELQQSIDGDFDVSILVWHIATELCYYLDDGRDSIKEQESNNQSRVKEKSSMSLRLSRYMLYLLFMCPSMLPAKMGKTVRFRDIYKKPNKRFEPSRGHNRRERKPDIWAEQRIAEALKALLDQMKNSATRDELLDRMKMLDTWSWKVSTEDQFNSVLTRGCRLAFELERVPRGRKWSVISEVWVEMLMYAANKSKARDHAHLMQRGGELITHVWLLMAHYGLTYHFQIPHDEAAIAEIIVNPW
ncbi:uncharacterized protein LOC115691022 [Syzygium oleosum]|uniref:uncharacterized protein LOC115691022 n=1 Tax=Syzygium oleosum TaxID=219896 RepID=UPI0024B955E4|nr:uncharacterized protein LOC115691022 [Syzygium oleosum]